MTTAPPRPSRSPLPSGAAAASLDLPSPPAGRLGRPRWLDARLIAGVLLVLGSVALGSRVIAGADDTVPVWATRGPLAAGVEVRAADLVERHVLLNEGLDAYVSAEGGVPAGYVALRDVGAGELLPRAAIAPAAELAVVRYVTVTVPAAELPYGVGAGSHVDVWIVPAEPVASAPPGSPPGSPASGGAQRLLAGAGVAALSSESGALGVSGSTRGVVLAVEQGDLSDAAYESVIARLIAANRAGLVSLAALPAGSR